MSQKNFSLFGLEERLQEVGKDGVGSFRGQLGGCLRRREVGRSRPPTYPPTVTVRWDYSPFRGTCRIVFCPPSLVLVFFSALVRPPTRCSTLSSGVCGGGLGSLSPTGHPLGTRSFPPGRVETGLPISPRSSSEETRGRRRDGILRTCGRNGWYLRHPRKGPAPLGARFLVPSLVCKTTRDVTLEVRV